MENIGDYVNNAKIEGSLGHVRPLNDEEKAAFLYGYVYRMAEEAKEDGLFETFSIAEVVRLFIDASADSFK